MYYDYPTSSGPTQDFFRAAEDATFHKHYLFQKIRVNSRRQAFRLKSHFCQQFLGDDFPMLKGDADQACARRVVSGHNGSQGKVLETTQHVPFAVAALDPDFILFLTDHWVVSFA